MRDLFPYRALVGGSTRSIGRAVARLLAERGGGLTLLARHEDCPRETGYVHVHCQLFTAC